MQPEAVGAQAPTARLARLDTCAVSDALDRLGLPGTVHGIHAAWDCGPVAGRVVTVKLRRARPGERPSVHLGARAIEQARPGDVIVVAHQERSDAAGWGGLLSLAARLKGVAGVIVDGACRDVDGSREIGFAVYARSAVPTTARGRAVEDATGVPVAIADLTVEPGDLVIADGSGVVFVPGARSEEVLDLTEEIAERERRLAAMLRAGRPVVEVMGAGYESLLDRGGL